MVATKNNQDYITDRFINRICKRIADRKPIRRTLPFNGRLHIDRPLPFICLYRKPTRNLDAGTEKLVKGEASYLITSATGRIKSQITSLLENVITEIADEYGAFLIIEIWTKKRSNNSNNNGQGFLDPSIRLKISKSHFPTKTIETIERALQKITILRKKVNVSIEYTRAQWPDNLASPVSSVFAKKRNCFFIGIELDPFFQDSTTGAIYPLVLRKIHQGLSRAIKMGVYEFSHHQTTLRPTNFQALGRRAMVKAVWEVDQRLAEISSTFDFLLLVTPINIDQAWNKFQTNKFKVPPNFYYRPIPINLSSTKSKLYDIPIGRIEDPSIASLFVEKQIELERNLSMLRDRGTRNFFYGSMQLYGDLDTELLNTARMLIENILPHAHQSSQSVYFNAKMFGERAQEEIEYYHKNYDGINARVEIRDDITGLMVSRGNLFVGSKVNIPKTRVEALLQHEVGTHILTYFNGRVQPFQQLYTGLAGYDELQEGIAVLAEYLVGGLNGTRLRLLAGRVIAAHCLISGATFIETFNELHKKLDFSQRIAYIITARIFRGGGIIKDAIYLRGLIKILDYFRDGGKLDSLLVGKISSEHLHIIKELYSRKILKPIPLKPRYLENSEAISKLEQLRSGISVIDLIKRR